MQSASQYGVYQAEVSEVVARSGPVVGKVFLCLCDDGLYRSSVSYAYGIGGGGGPISRAAPGFSSMDAARTAGIEQLLRRFGSSWQSVGHPAAINRAAAQVVAQLQARVRQPSLFDLMH